MTVASVQEAIDATEGSVTDTLREALADAEAQDWQHVMIIGVRGDQCLVRILSVGMPFHTQIGMTSWASALDHSLALNIDHVDKEL